MTSRTSSGPGIDERRRAILEAIQDAHPPQKGSPTELRSWACRQIDRGEPEGTVAIALGWTVVEVRAAVAERAA